ncbi:hypothetical protein ACS0TY_012481 [Phlomoides rotata]
MVVRREKRAFRDFLFFLHKKKKQKKKQLSLSLISLSEFLRNREIFFLHLYLVHYCVLTVKKLKFDSVERYLGLKIGFLAEKIGIDYRNLRFLLESLLYATHIRVNQLKLLWILSFLGVYDINSSFFEVILRDSEGPIFRYFYQILKGNFRFYLQKRYRLQWRIIQVCRIS